MKHFIWFFSYSCMLFFYSPGITAQESGNRDIRLQEIGSAVDGDFYEKALELIESGTKDYPEDYRFPLARGDLYEDQELYTLALESYREAEALDRSNSVDLRRQIASTMAYLDMNFQSLSYLETLVDEGEQSLLDDLGWMYFKTHQPEKGILRIRASLNEEFDRNLSLTLGTLYSEINQPDLCRKYYLDAIRDAEDHKDSYFASVGYYNLSLAEKSFYDYEAAERYAAESLKLMDRAAGHLALGDLYMMKQSFSDAEREFREAVDLDKTPLSRTNLASLFRVQGRLDESLAEIAKIEEENDGSWMYYYGLNQDQFVMDLYRQYYDIYKGKVQQLRLFREWGFSERIDRRIKIIEYSGKALYYRLLYRLLAFREGQSQVQGGSELRGSLTLASGAEGFSRYSKKYYLRALALEDFPQAKPWYDLMIGQELKDTELLSRAEKGLNSEWEKQPLEDVFRNRALLMKRRSPERDALILKLYRMNPGALTQYGFKLPLELHVSGESSSGNSRGQVRRLKQYLQQSGFNLRSGQGNAIVLRVRFSDPVHYTMSGSDGRVLFSEEIETELNSPQELRLWVDRFRTLVFSY